MPVQLLWLAAALIIWASDARADMITLTVGPIGQYKSVNAATSFANTDDNLSNYYDIVVAPGTYTNDFSTVTRPMTIEAAIPGSQVLLLATVPPPNLKAIIWTNSSLTVNGLTFQGAAIPSSDGGNGAGIRDQSNTSTSLVVENSKFIGNQEGILTGSDSGQTFAETVTISNSQFINNGNPDPSVFQHALYVGDAGSLSVSNSLFCGQVIGHDIKSRALKTAVQSSQMFIGAAGPAGCNVGSTSIGVDVPNGGMLDLVGDMLVQGPANQNGALVSYGEEGLHPIGANTFDVADSTFTSTAHGLAIQELPTCLAPVTLTNDTFQGVRAIINQPSCATTTTVAAVYSWEGYATVTVSSPECSGVDETAPGATFVSIFRPKIASTNFPTYLSFIFLRAAITQQNTSESVVPQMNGSGNYTGFEIGPRAVFSQYTGTYNLTLTPAIITALTSSVIIDGTITNFFNATDCTVTFEGAYVQRMD